MAFHGGGAGRSTQGNLGTVVSSSLVGPHCSIYYTLKSRDAQRKEDEQKLVSSGHSDQGRWGRQDISLP